MRTFRVEFSHTSFEVAETTRSLAYIQSAWRDCKLRVADATQKALSLRNDNFSQETWIEDLVFAHGYYLEPNICFTAASERSERAATLIVTGFLWSWWSMSPSRLGYYYYSQAISDIEIRPSWWAGWLWMILWIGKCIGIYNHACDMTKTYHRFQFYATTGGFSSGENCVSAAVNHTIYGASTKLLLSALQTCKGFCVFKISVIVRSTTDIA